MYRKSIIMNLIYILLGITLVVLSMREVMEEVYAGVGGSLVAVGILQLVRLFRMKTDKAYQEKIEMKVSDERNQFLRMKAWSWTGYICILGLGVATIVFLILSMEVYMQISSFLVCGILVVYWICYLVLNKKY